MSISVPTIINLTLTLANTEYSQALSSFSSKFMMQCRTLADLRAFTLRGFEALVVESLKEIDSRLKILEEKID